eukprot:352629-Pyramimonas_sp.AAC.1
MWCCWPRWVMAQPTSEPAVSDYPAYLADRNVSDHAAHVVRVSQRTVKPAQSNRIPRDLFESEGYQQQLKAVRDKLNYADKSTPRQTELHKWSIREVASDYRGRLFHRAP